MLNALRNLTTDDIGMRSDDANDPFVRFPDVDYWFCAVPVTSLPELIGGVCQLACNRGTMRFENRCEYFHFLSGATSIYLLGDSPEIATLCKLFEDRDVAVEPGQGCWSVRCVAMSVLLRLTATMYVTDVMFFFSLP
jgi:hypothetical protein